MPWYVITGGPHSGTDLLIDSLALLGYHTVPEAARVYIEQANSKGISTGELRRDEKSFQRHVFQLKLDIEARTPRHSSVFFTRGIPDTIAYCKLHGWDTSEFEELSRGRPYIKVFCLDQIPGYKNDSARIEDEETAEEIGRLLHQNYRELEYNIVKIPVLPIEQRAEVILSNL